MKFFKRKVVEEPDNQVVVAQPNTRPPLDYDDLARSCVLLSNFRSGTHFLKTSLAQLGGLTALPEAFNLSLHKGVHFSFRDFLAADGNDPVRALSDSGRTLYDYLPYVFERCPAPNKVLFDIKYSQSYVLGVNERLMVPVVLEELAKAKLPIIHLIRRDVVAQAVSMMVAEQTGEFYAKGQADSRQFWLDPAKVHAMAQARVFAIKEATRHLETVNARVLTVFYEDLLGAQLPSELRRVMRFIDHYTDIPADFTPVTQAQNSLGRVANLDEIVAHIAGKDPALVVNTRLT